MNPGGTGVDPIENLYSECGLCPRDCGVDRRRGQRGFCGEAERLRIAWAGLHMGEEPPLTGEHGSGTIFFSGCTLKCASCQNCQLSREGAGREVSIAELRDLMLRLQDRGAANINLVTASHFAPSIIESTAEARSAGLAIPLVWNCSGYESPATLDLLRESVDVYLPDCKTLDPDLSGRYMNAGDYPAVARKAIITMAEQQPLGFDGDVLRRGLIMRHLVLPGYLEQSREVLSWFSEHLAGRALLSLMFQYTPVKPEGRSAEPERRINGGEYERVLSWLGELGIEDGFLQDPAKDDAWLPDFTRLNPFPEGQAVVLWHHAHGIVH